MKVIILLLFISTVIIVQSCQKEIVKINEYEKNILGLSLSRSIAHLQSNTECNTLIKNRVKSMSIIEEIQDSSKLDSLTFVEYNFGGKIVRRTTIENSTQGCLPYMIRQEFMYEKGKLKKITNYTFKYKTNSILQNWKEVDTSRMRMFDWEDYTYDGDTIIVESGYKIEKFVQDENKNIVQRIEFIKTNKQTDTLNYMYSGPSIQLEVNSAAYQNKLLIDYSLDNNKVLIKSESGENKFRRENVFNSQGLLVEDNWFLNDKLVSKRRVEYSFY